MKQALVLGAGLVTRPMVRYLLEHTPFGVTVASRTEKKAAAMVQGHPRGRTVAWTTDDLETLRRMIQDHDVVISMLPHGFHTQVARIALEHRKPLVTTSYVSPEMKALDQEARQRGVLLLNEIGLDPGIDHMSAMRTIDRYRARGARILSFESHCGALPAPEANDNPWGYKFAWSPKGVLQASTRAARFLRQGRVYEVRGVEIFDHVETHTLEEVGTVEVYPNRDSLQYRDLYDIPEVHTLFRGTVRWPGWAESMAALAHLGYLTEAETVDPRGLTYAGFLRRKLGIGPSEDLRRALARRLGVPEDAPVLERFAWLGLLDEVPVPRDARTPLDLLLHLMLQKLQYREGERDMVILQDIVEAEFPDGRRERHTSVLLDFGVVGKETAVARTVSLPAAIAARLLLEGRIHLTGVWIPTHPEIYEPVLQELQNLGTLMKERVEAAVTP